VKNTTWWRGALVALGIGAFACGAYAEGPNVVNNPGFEGGTSAAGAPTGWTTTGFIAPGFDFFVDSDPTFAHSGTHSFAGGGIGAPGFLNQTLSTPGGFYTMSLWLRSDGFLPNELEVLVNGAARADLTDVLIGPYTLVNLSFTPTGATTSLSIGLRNDSGFLHIDDVSVNVPEPTSVALVGLGLAALAWRRRARS
jgi:hypothetical protein